MQDSEAQSLITLDLGMVRAFLLRGQKRHVLVDTGLRSHGKKILEMLEALEIDPRAISLIVLTHDHADHLGSAWQLKQATGASIAMHLLGAETARTGKPPLTKAVRLVGKIMAPLLRLLGRWMPFHAFEPDVLIAGEMRLDEFGVAAKIIPTPGHTAGHLSILLDSGEVLIGDLVGGRKKPSFSPFGDSLESMRASIAMILEERPRLVFGSHGGPFTPEEIRKTLKI